MMTAITANALSPSISDLYGDLAEELSEAKGANVEEVDKGADAEEVELVIERISRKHRNVDPRVYLIRHVYSNLL